jgi:hypothetical protein
MSRSKRSVFVALGLVAATSAAGSSNSWAYVVAAEHVKGSYKHPSNDCRVTAKVPQRRPASAPAPGDESSLRDAETFTELVSDPFEHCEDFVHTWQVVTFPSGSSPSFVSWPLGPVNFSFLFAGFALLFALGALAWQRLRRPREPE